MSPKAAPRKRTAFEISVLVAAIAAVSLVFVGLILARFSGAEGPADLRTSIRATGEQGSGGLLYEVLIRNVGGETAENVVIEASIGEEIREAEVLSVSKGDEERVTVIFPAGLPGTPQVRVLSYHMTTRG